MTICCELVLFVFIEWEVAHIRQLGSNDFRILTPNDFLNRPPPADLPIGDFERAPPHENYRYFQRTANLFWDMCGNESSVTCGMEAAWKEPGGRRLPRSILGLVGRTSS